MNQTTWQIHQGDVLAHLALMPDESVNCCVTSPPYFGLRDYGCPGQIGLEPTPAAFVEKMVEVFDQVRRVLKADGTLWLNLGDSYAGSGKGGNPEAGTKQGTNQGSQSVGVLYGRGDSKEDERARIKEQNKAILADGSKPKDMLGIPWRVAFALQEAGWYLRQDIIWAKPNPMPESVTDRCTKSHEYLFLLSKSPRYYYDAEAIAEPLAESSVARLSQPTLEQQAGSDRVPGKTNGNMKAVSRQKHGRDYDRLEGIRPSGPSRAERKSDKQRGHSRRHAGFNDRWDEMERADQCSGLRNKRDVWTVATQPFPGSHFATFPPELIRPCILAGCPEGGTVLDPFTGAGTTGMVSVQHGRNFVGIELNPKYVEMASRRIAADAGFMAVEAVI